MNSPSEKIESLRRLQVGIYLLHVGLLVGGLIYFTKVGEIIFAIVAVPFVFYAAMDLLDKRSTIRAPVDRLGIQSIDRNLRGLDWLMIGVLSILTVAEGVALLVYEPSQSWALPIWIPFLLTAALAPLIVFGWMFDRSTRGGLFTFVRSGFRFPPPDDEFWDDARANHREIKDISLVFIVFEASIALQFLMLAIWSGSTGMLVLWSILLTSVLRGMPLTRKADPVPFPPSGYPRSR